MRRDGITVRKKMTLLLIALSLSLSLALGTLAVNVADTAAAPQEPGNAIVEACKVAVAQGVFGLDLTVGGCVSLARSEEHSSAILASLCHNAVVRESVQAHTVGECIQRFHEQLSRRP
jgi:hypothetical protein